MDDDFDKQQPATDDEIEDEYEEDEEEAHGDEAAAAEADEAEQDDELEDLDDAAGPAVEEQPQEDDDNVNDGEAVVLAPSELLAAQFRSIEEVNSVLSISAGTARSLLAHFNWNKERLMERYYGGDPDELFAEAKCVNPRDFARALSVDSMIMCEICLCHIPGGKCAQLPCGHPFCHDCWLAYLREKIITQGTQSIECPAYGCKVFVDEYTVTQLLQGNKELLDRYLYLVAKAFVRGNSHVQWCPARDCQYAVELAYPRPRSVRCKCGHEFCFACQEHRHIPLKCTMLNHWLKKCADDSETSNWISVNTKECPRCHSTIEKNGGCNHMTCNSCKHEFCWVCLGAWQPHGSSWYNCNRFDEADSLDAREKQKQSRHSLERYLFYFHRYDNHGRSLQLEGKLWKMIELKQRDMQKAGFSWIEVQYLTKAVKALTDARTVLRNTYVFAFYLEKTNECQIFENNQRDLEMATENLSGYLEGEASAADHRTLKQKVMDLSKYCDHRRKVLIDHVNEGYQKQSWQYNVGDIRRIMQEACKLDRV